MHSSFAPLNSPALVLLPLLLFAAGCKERPSRSQQTPTSQRREAKHSPEKRAQQLVDAYQRSLSRAFDRTRRQSDYGTTERNGIVKELIALGPVAIPAVLTLFKESSNMEQMFAKDPRRRMFLSLKRGFMDKIKYARARQILRKMGPKAFPALEKGLSHSDKDIRFHVVRTLGQIPSLPPTLIRALKRALKDDELDVVKEASRVLGTLEAKASSKPTSRKSTTQPSSKPTQHRKNPPTSAPNKR